MIQKPTLTILNSDCLVALKTLPDNSVHCCVTSPPYYGLRNYKVEGQIGLEETPQQYIEKMVEVFREVKRVLREDGVCWLNLGDSYAANRTYQVPSTKGGSKHSPAQGESTGNKVPEGLKPKDLIMIPARVALALQADGWYLRGAYPWIKRNGMPESVKSRPSQTIEQIFMLTKNERYFYDAEAVKKPLAASSVPRLQQDIANQVGTERANGGVKTNGNFKAVEDIKIGRSRRSSDWFFESWQGMLQDEEGDPLAFVVNTKPYRGAHFAVFPPELIRPMVAASTRKDDGCTVLDPFGGSGTTAQVALEHGCNAIVCELNPDYVPLIHQRCDSLLNKTAESSLPS